MKRVISKTLLILMIINAILSVSVYAGSGDIAVYNNDEEIKLYTPVEQAYGKYYVYYKDLREFPVYFDFDWYYEMFSMYGYDGFTSLICYAGSNAVRINGTSLLYNNPVITRNGGYYISLELFAMVFSTKYDIVENNRPVH